MTYVFGDFTLEPDLLELTRGGEVVAVEPQVFGLILYLIENRSRVVSKDELIEAVWDGRFVSDSAISSRVKSARQALGDDARAPEFIQTVHGRGYRFLKPVEERASAPSAAPTAQDASPVARAASGPAAPAWLRGPVGLIAAAALVLIGALIVWPRGEPAPAAPAPEASIAVLAFEDLSPNRDQSYFSDGIAEEILNSLVKLEGLQVAGRTSSFSFKGSQTDLKTIGETLGVAYILEGSVRRQDERIRVTAQLIQADNGFHEWSKVYERDADDIFSIQDDIARAVATELQILLGDDTPLVQRPTDDREAYRLYLQGRSMFARRIGDNIAGAIEAFEAAVQRDPDFARAHAALATAHAVHPDYDYSLNLDDVAETARGYAERAIALDPSLADPYAALGIIAFDGRDYVASREAFDRALQLEPKNVDALYWKAVLLRSLGALQDAAALSEQAVSIDPVSPLGYVTQASYSLTRGDLETARTFAAKARDLGHPSGGYLLARIAEATGESAVATRLHTESLVDAGVATAFSEPDVMTLLRGVYETEADADATRALIRRYAASDGPKRDITAPAILMELGDAEDAIALFRESRTSLDAFFLTLIWTESRRAMLDGDAFQTLAEEIGMTDYWRVFGWPDRCAAPSPGSWRVVDCRPATD